MVEENTFKWSHHFKTLSDTIILQLCQTDIRAPIVLLLALIFVFLPTFAKLYLGNYK